MTADTVPQDCFDDLYTAVYALIDDAKAEYRVEKLYKGSHGSPNPHPTVTDFGAWFFERRRGLLGYACEKSRPGATRYIVDDLAEFDRTSGPRGLHGRCVQRPGREPAAPGKPAA